MIQAIVGILCGLGLFYILVDLYAIPYYKTSKAVESISKQQKEKTSGLDVWLKGVAGFFAKHMRLNEFKKAQLQNDLNTAQMNISPEMFKANAIVKSLIIATFAIPVLFILPLLSPIILVLAIALYNNEVRSVSKRIKAKRTVNPTEPAVVSVIIGFGNPDKMLNTIIVIGERIHKKVARAMRHEAFFLCSIYAFASSIEILFMVVSKEVSLVNSSTSISSFKR